MKKIWIYFGSAMLFGAVLAGCSEEELSKTSVIKPTITEENDFDRWIDRNYVQVYNIQFKYRFEDIESSMGYYLTPADYDQSIAMAKLVRHLCLEAYDEVTGSTEFIRANFPKIIFLSGSPAYKTNGSEILGTAEGGKKITLFNIDKLNPRGITSETAYFKTIHHEFGHILNQTKPYSADFKKISGPDYVGDDCWTVYATDASALQKGLITRYAGSGDGEDFVELSSIYVTRTPEKWESMLKTAGETGRPIIEEKFEIVYNYLLNSWDIDLNQLRDVVLRRAAEAKDLDLESLDDDPIAPPTPESNE